MTRKLLATSLSHFRYSVRERSSAHGRGPCRPLLDLLPAFRPFQPNECVRSCAQKFREVGAIRKKLDRVERRRNEIAFAGAVPTRCAQESEIINREIAQRFVQAVLNFGARDLWRRARDRSPVWSGNEGVRADAACVAIPSKPRNLRFQKRRAPSAPSRRSARCLARVSIDATRRGSAPAAGKIIPRRVQFSSARN